MTEKHILFAGRVPPVMVWIIAPDGFEPSSSAPKADMLDRYTTGLYSKRMRKGL